MSESVKPRTGDLTNERPDEPTEQSQPAQRAVSPPFSSTLTSSLPFGLSFRTKPRLLASSLAGLTLIVVIYLALAITFSQVMHFSRALDEGYHLEYITFIKQNGRLPTTYEERGQITRADFPPLYQLLVALLSAQVNVDGPPDFKLFWDSFRYRAMDHQSDQVWTIATEDYQRPYLGRFLVWQMGRWFSIVLSLGTLIIVFMTLQETPLGRSPALPLAGAAILAFIPRYMMLGSALNDDSLLGLLAAVYFWALVKAFKDPQRWWPFVVMGISLGLSMTVKYTLVLLPLEIALLCGLLAQQNGLGWSWAWRRLVVTGLLALLCSSWWFGWNIWFLNTIKTQGWFLGLLNPLLAGGNDTTMNRLGGLVSGGQIGLANLPEDTIVGTFPQWLQSTFLSFWGTSTSFSYAYLAIGLML
ncbi:MAG TPA: glycosyltransferase family 39 protein, partial [Anaerolineae bacterium]|nr:glycosyltransferase family 39 protein [Anaerolineae bacterium]